MALWLAQVIGLVFVVGSAFIMGVVVGYGFKEERKA